METTELLWIIADNIKKNKGKLDLTNDLGEAYIYDIEKCLPITDLILDKDDEPAVVVPLGYFSDEIIERIHKQM